jgi:glycosyltransferase involved in cell wall biosynthesis
MKVLHFNSLLAGGGTDDQCVKLVHGLHQLGQPVWLAGPDGREFSKVARHLGVPFHATPPDGPLKLQCIVDAARFARRERVQIVHGHHGRDLWPTILVARLSRVHPKVVLTRHLAKSPSSWVSRRFLLGQCDALIAVSQFVANVLREGAYEPDSPEPERRARPPLVGDHSKIQVIHGGIDTSRFCPFDATAQRREWGLEPQHYAFAVVGGYDLPRGKGQREYLKAAALIHARIPRARFLVVGRGNLKETLEADIFQLGLSGKAWLPPYCRDMPAAMNAIDCLVHPQVGTEAFPGVVLEAYACGKPVIASALDGIPEAFAAGGIGRLVKPEAVDELAAALIEQAGRPAFSPEQSAQLHRRIADRFSLDANARAVRALYEQLMNK